MCSKMSVCLADITGGTACATKFINNTDRDNLEMASLALGGSKLAMAE